MGGPGAGTGASGPAPKGLKLRLSQPPFRSIFNSGVREIPEEPLLYTNELQRAALFDEGDLGHTSFAHGESFRRVRPRARGSAMLAQWEFGRSRPRALPENALRYEIVGTARRDGSLR